MKDFIHQFKILPLSNKAMVYLMWIYSAWWVITSIFINIYIFQFQKEIVSVIIYNLVYLTATFIWFSIIGWVLWWVLKRNIRNFYYISYFFFVLSFLIIFSFQEYIGTLIFAVIYGLWNGIFRCWVHTQELVHIEDNVRDAYSSYISFGTSWIKIWVPLFVSIIFFIVWKHFHFSPYIVLFLLLPVVYMASFFFIKNIWNYTTTWITMKDVKNFFNMKKYLFAHVYFFCMWAYQSLTWTILPIVAIYLLKTEIHVWVYEGVMMLISTFLVAFLSSMRKPKNRVKIMGILSLLIFSNLFLFVFHFTFWGYVAFSLIWVLLDPLYRISEHVFDLRLMDTIRYKESDFFSTMILRDFVLWIWRSVSLVALLFLVYYGLGNQEIFKVTLSWVGIFMIFTWVWIYLHMKYDYKEWR